jgi:outer membrane murein-binding lipoprotein Lpp
MRAISVLSDLLTRVKELYDVMGVDLEPTSVIRGDTLAAQTAWLENEIQKIESQIQDLMAEIQAMSMDPDIREKMASMAGEETRKATLLGLEQAKKAFEEKNAVLQAEHPRTIDNGRTPVASQ